jgi:hypothetical protein
LGVGVDCLVMQAASPETMATRILAPRLQGKRKVLASS